MAAPCECRVGVLASLLFAIFIATIPVNSGLRKVLDDPGAGIGELPLAVE